MKAIVKPDKIREETYDAVVRGMEKEGFAPVGRTKEGLVYENHVDGEHVVIKVIKKKAQVNEEDMTEVTTYEEKFAEYEKAKQEKKEKQEQEQEETEEEKGFNAA